MQKRLKCNCTGYILAVFYFANVTENVEKKENKNFLSFAAGNERIGVEYKKYTDERKEKKPGGQLS